MKRILLVFTAIIISMTMLAQQRTQEVTPIVATQWNQYNPFNGLCPMLNGNRCATGCVATAMAQALNVYQYPDHVEGQVDYTTGVHGIHLQENLSDYPFRWQNMLDMYKQGYYSPENGDAVAALMYACGLTVNMDYGRESNSYPNLAMRSLVERFGYDRDMALANRDAMLPGQWHDILTRALAKGMPVIYSGSNENGLVHSFIIDGYKTEGNDLLYHVNWGWGGKGDGYYMLRNLSPEELDADVEKGNFNLRNTAIIGIKPDDGVKENCGFLQAKRITLSPEVMLQGQTAATDEEEPAITVRCEGLFNYGYETFGGRITAYLVDASGNRAFVGEYNITSLPYYSGWQTIQLTAMLPEGMPAGNYTLEMYAQAEGMEEQPVYNANEWPVLNVCSTLEDYEPDINISEMTAVVTDNRSVAVSISDMANCVQEEFTGQIRLAVADTDDNILHVFGTSVSIEGLRIFDKLHMPSTLRGTIPAETADGTYRLWLVAQQQGYGNWAKVRKAIFAGNFVKKKHMPCYASVKITNGLVSIEGEPSSIDGVLISDDAPGTPAVYSITGQRLDSQQPGINIIVTKRGVKKVMK